MKDPVCGMESPERGLSLRYDYRGGHYEFCSEGCQRAFVREPEQFLIANTFNYHEIDPIDAFLRKIVHQIDPETYPFMTYRPREKEVRLIVDKGGQCRSIRLKKEEVDKAKWDANSREELEKKVRRLVKKVTHPWSMTRKQ